MNRATGRAIAYTDTKTRAYESLVAMSAAAHRPPKPFAGGVAVELMAVFERPSRLLARSKRTGELLHDAVEGRMVHLSRPDLDNVVKAVLDGLNGQGYWPDDMVICDVRARKRYAAVGEPAGVIVRVGSVEEFDT